MSIIARARSFIDVFSRGSYMLTVIRLVFMTYNVSLFSVRCISCRLRNANCCVGLGHVGSHVWSVLGLLHLGLEPTCASVNGMSLGIFFASKIKQDLSFCNITCKANTKHFTFHDSQRKTNFSNKTAAPG